MACNTFISLVNYLITEIDDFIQLLSASELAMICMVTGCQLKPTDKRYLSPLRDMPRFAGWLRSMVGQGHVAKLVGKDLHLLEMRIGRPIEFWRIYPNNICIEMWLMVVNVTATQTFGRLGDGNVEVQHRTGAVIPIRTYEAEDFANHNAFMWPAEATDADCASTSDDTYWARFQEDNNLYIWLADRSRYSSGCKTSVGIGLRAGPEDQTVAPGLVMSPPLVETSTIYAVNNVRLLRATTMYIDLNELVGEKKAPLTLLDDLRGRAKIPVDETARASTSKVTMYYGIPNKQECQVGYLSICDDHCFALVMTAWGFNMRVALPYYHEAIDFTVKEQVV